MLNSATQPDGGTSYSSVCRGVAIASALAVLVTALVMGAPTAGWAVEQHQNGSAYVHWDFGGDEAGFWNVDQVINIRKKAPATYWAISFNYVDTPFGGYLGIQTDGSRFDGSSGETAIFSLWGSDAFRSDDGTCGKFAWESGGDGYSCRMPWTIKNNAQYRLRVWRLTPDDDGVWWGAWIYSTHSGHEYHLGDLRVPHEHRLLENVLNFSEYFGPARACDKVPVSRTNFTQPAANLRGDVYDHYSTFDRADALDCTNYSVSNTTLRGFSGVLLQLGGRRRTSGSW